MSDPTQGATSVTFEDIERQSTQDAATAADVTQMKVDGQDIPEHLRGKSVKEIIAALEGTGQALKLSEAARLQVQPVQQAPAPVVEQPKEISDEEIQQMYEEQPLRAIEAMNQRAIQRAERNLEVRLGPLINGSAAQVEQSVRAKYADEFALFGDEITQVASGIPNRQAVLSNPAAWDDLVALVRGRENNFNRLLQHKASKTTQVSRQQAQLEQVAGVGFSDNSGGRGRAPTSVAGLDPIQKEIAEKMGLTPDDYVKWSKIS